MALLWVSPLLALVVLVAWLAWKVYARERARAEARAKRMEGADQSEVIS